MPAPSSEAHRPRTGSAPPLLGIRVVDLTDQRGDLCGRILADLGAEVIKVEPPGGTPARRHPPLLPDGTSAFWAAMGRGKRSVVLDLDDSDGLDRLDRLLAGADVVVESFDSSRRRELDLERLDRRYEHLVHTSITPCGCTGPHAEWPSADIVVEATAGRVAMQGDRDRPPLPLGYPQSFFQGAGVAAADTVIALYERDRSGRGQHLDTSAREAVIWTLMNVTGYPPLTGRDPVASGDERANERTSSLGDVRAPGVEAVADGHVVVTPPVLGPVTQRSFAMLMGWVAADGLLDPPLEQLSWGTFVTDVRAGSVAAADLERGFAALRTWLATRTKAELHRRAFAERVLLAPIATTVDVLADEQLRARNYWVATDHHTHAPVWARLSGTPLVAEPTPAPTLGADQRLLERPRVPACPAEPNRPGRGPVFAGLKVADLTWAAAGPYISKCLADHGATTVKVESITKPDNLRFLPPFLEGAPPLENGHAPANFNTNKLSLGVDLGTDDGRRILHRLVGWADVVVENMTPGALDRLGVGYEALRSARPDLIVLSTSLRGQTGPEKLYTGFGQQGAALSGFFAVTGWPDRPPVGPWGPYTDFVTPRFAVAALAAAIRHRNATGAGQLIDVSQIEATLQFLEPEVIASSVTGIAAPPAGQVSGSGSPHGVFATAGAERYIAVSCETDEQRRGLDAVLTADGPESREDTGERLRRWASTRQASDAVETLIEAGVPAGLVARASDLHADPQLAHREFFRELDHRTLGRVPFDASPTRFSATPAMLFDPGPTLGQHTGEVVRDLLGFDDTEIAEFAAADVLR